MEQVRKGRVLQPEEKEGNAGDLLVNRTKRMMVRVQEGDLVSEGEVEITEMTESEEARDQDESEANKW
jgi:hypothetical protein